LVETSWKKIARFFNMRLLDLRFLWENTLDKGLERSKN
jgi:hypothetical protein